MTRQGQGAGQRLLKTVHMCSKSVCVHVGLGVVGCACGFMSLIIRFSQTMHVIS